MIISKILEQFKNNYILPKDMLVGRLILLLFLSKTGNPWGPVDKTRPKAVQSMAITIIVKMIKRNLELCSTWENLRIDDTRHDSKQVSVPW